MTTEQLLEVWRHIADLILVLEGHDPECWV